MIKQNIGKCKMSTILGYGVGGAGENLAYGIFYTYFLFFLTGYAGISPGGAGIISLIAVCWDAITDPMVGYLSDKFKGNKWGKRVPFIMGGAIPLFICIFLMFCDVNMGSTAKVAYFLFINVLFWLFFTMVDIPYIAVANELSDDYDTKTKLRTSSMLFAAASQILLSSGVVMFIDFMAKQGESDILTWRIVGATIGAISSICFIISAVTVKGKELKKNEEEIEASSQKSIKEIFVDVKQLFSMRQYRLNAGMGFFYSMVNGVIASGLMYYFMFTCGLSNESIASIFLIASIAYIILVIPIGGFVVKFGKKQAMMGGFVVMLLNAVLVWFVTPNVPIGAMFYLILNAYAIVFWINIYTMNYDISELYEYKFNTRCDGFAVSLTAFLIKVGMAVGMWTTGTLMEVLKVDPMSPTVTEKMANSMNNIVIGVPIILLVIMIILCSLYKVDKQSILDVQNALAKRKAGEEYDDSSFKQLLG